MRLGPRSNSSPSGLERGFMGFPALHTGLFIFDPFGIGAKAPNTSIFDASRLKALNMNSPRQSLGRSMQPETSLEGLNHKALGKKDNKLKVTNQKCIQE
jgi:hypothetical protein